MDFVNDIIKKWHDTHAFEIEKDRFKPKRIIKCPSLSVNSNDITPTALYSYLVADVYNRYYKMLGENVFYSVGFDFPCFESYDFMSNHYLDYKSLFKQYQESLDLLGVGYDRESLYSFYEESTIKYIQSVFVKEYGKSITYKNGNVLMDSLGLHIYNRYEATYSQGHYYLKSTGEELFFQNVDYYALNIKEFHKKIDSVLENIKITDEQKNEIKEGFGYYSFMELPLYNYKCNIKLQIKLKNPEFMAGVAALMLNPLHMDVMPYVDDYEKNTVVHFMQNGYQEGVFTGNVVKNPLTGEDILLFVSYDFDEDIHVLIPSIDEKDATYAQAFGIEYMPIIENDVIINSDFLNGLDRDQARKIIIDSFIDEGMAHLAYDYEIDELIISKKEGYGIPIPVFLQDEKNYVVADEDFLPIYYNNRKKTIITNEERLTSNFEFGSFEFNDGFIKAIEPIVMMCIDATMGQPRDSFVGKTLQFVNKNNVFEEYIYPLILSDVLNMTESNIEYEFLDIKPTSQKSLSEYASLNINFTHDILKDNSCDAYRMYILCADLSENFDMVKLQIAKYQSFLDELTNKYKGGFNMESTTIDIRFYSVTQELTSCIESKNIAKYTETLLHFFYEFVINKDMSGNEAIVFLKLVSIICPFISQQLYEETFNQNYLIIYEEWPLQN